SLLWSHTASVEQAWNELIDRAVVGSRSVAAGGPAKGGQGRTAPHVAVEPTTLSQFQLAVWISLAAAENDFHELSLRAIREALSGGLPSANLPTAQAALTIGGQLTGMRPAGVTIPGASPSPMPVGPPPAGATISPPPTRGVAPATPFAPPSIPSRFGGGQRVQS